MELTPIEIRVLGALVEKDRTTPDSYPLSTNALLAACNQKTSRDPVLSLTSADVDTAMLELRQRELARTVKGAGERSYKHRHTFQAAMGFDDEQLAVIAVLMLRGAQTPGEIRTRTDRYLSFPGVEEVERTLAHLAARDEPLVRNLGRGPGQSQDRWIHLLADDDAQSPVAAVDEIGAPPVGAPVSQSTTSPSAPSVSASTVPSGRAESSGEVAVLRSEVAELRLLVADLYEQLGMEMQSGSSDEAE